MALKFNITYLERKNHHYIIGIDFSGHNGLYNLYINNGMVFWDKRTSNPGFMITDSNNCIPINGEAEEIFLSLRGTDARTRELEKDLERELNIFKKNQS